MGKTDRPDPRQMSLFDKMLNLSTEANVETNIVIPLEVQEKGQSKSHEELALPEVPARWEAAFSAAEHKNVLPILLKQIRRVEALDYLEYLITLSRDEGYVWVVFGESGSGKSTFFHTLEYQTNDQIRKHIINGDDVNLSSQKEFSDYLLNIITRHKSLHGDQAPLVIVLEQRENSMVTEERTSIAQSLRNVLRPPGPGRNVVFVLPVVNSNQGTLFMNQVEATGVSLPLGHNALYTFHGPPYTDHVDIFIELFVALNDKSISEYGLERSSLQSHVSSQQTIGQYIRTIREEIVKANQAARNTIIRHNYKRFTVIICFVNPLPSYRTEPIVKAMTMDAYGRLRTGEILRVTQSQKAQRWENNRQALANIVSALDMRVVEVPPQIISKLIYAYQSDTRSSNDLHEPIVSVVERGLVQQGVDYNAPKAVRQNLRQQLRASNLFHILANEETRSYSTPRFSRIDDERQSKEEAEITITRLVCENSHSRQYELHYLSAMALEDVLKNNSNSVAGIADFKKVFPEPDITVNSPQRGDIQKVLRPDVVIEMQDKLFFLEFCWRSEEHFTYADIATYILRKIQESYMNLPLVRALSE